MNITPSHNEQCESCGEGGDLICCDLCNLVFHLGCHRPAMENIPNGSFICSFCVLEGNTGASAADLEKALLCTQELTALRNTAKEKIDGVNLTSLPLSTDATKATPATKESTIAPMEASYESTITPCTSWPDTTNATAATPTTDETIISPAEVLCPTDTTAASLTTNQSTISTADVGDTTTTQTSDPAAGETLPETTVRDIENFVKIVQEYKDNERAMDSILNLLSKDDDVHQQLETGLQNLSLNNDTKRSVQPPILSQAKFNGQTVNWDELPKVYPVNERAFSRNKPYGLLQEPGGPRHEVGTENTKTALKAENRAKNYERRKVVKAFRTVGDLEQKRLVLVAFLSDPEIRGTAASIGVNLEEARVGRHILENFRRVMRRTQKTTNKNDRLITVKRALVQTLAVAAVQTPPKDGTKKAPPIVSKRAVARALGFKSRGSSHRNLSKGEAKRAKIADGNVDGWVMIDEEEERTKFTEELLDKVEQWVIEGNEKVKVSPCKKDMLILHDRKGKIIRDTTTGLPLRVQRRMLLVCPRELHNLMIEDLPEATEDNKILISEGKLRQLLKTSCSHVKKVTRQDKLVCGCQHCILFEDLYRCLILWRRKFIKSWRESIKTMVGRRKSAQEAKLRQYINVVCSDEDGTKAKVESAWEVANLIGCDPVEIEGRSYAHFSCLLEKCNACQDKWKELVPIAELECDERINYVVFGMHRKCSYHIDDNIGIKDGEYYCKECETLTDEKKKALKGGTPKMKHVKLRIMITEKMCEFMKPGGTFETWLRKMYFHIAHVQLLGTKFCSNKMYEFADETLGALIMEIDYSERYQPTYMREIQSENFGKDADVSMEIRIATYKAKFEGPDSEPKKKTISYCSLSDEKQQIAATTFENTLQMLNDIFQNRKELTTDDLKMIIDIVDGCPAQYKCYTALYTLALMAHQTGKIYFRCVKCAGHGKCRGDAEGGCHKTFADKAFDKYVMLPEEERSGCSWVPNHKVEDGKLLSLAEIVQNILQDEDYVHGARSHSARKSKNAKKLIHERRFLLRLRGAAKYLGIKMTGKGFGNDKYMGLRAHHCFVADPQVPGFKVMACRIPCVCAACRARFQLPVEERYKNPRNDCEYWAIFQGWNDWREISFEPTTKCDGDQLIDSQEWTLKSIGERMARGIVMGGFGGYLADDKFKYYLVKWSEEPWQIEKDCVRMCGEEKCYLKKGDWVCRGRWLNYLVGAQYWYYVMDTEVLVRCQQVLCSDLKLLPHSQENDLPRMDRRLRADNLALNPLRITNSDHDFLMDAACHREELDYEVVVPDLGSDEESDHEDEDTEDEFFDDVPMEEVQLSDSE